MAMNCWPYIYILSGGMLVSYKCLNVDGGGCCAPGVNSCHYSILHCV